MAETYGLTINQWPGTWSPSASHPIVLDAQIRGALRTITGDSGDRLGDITGQRLQDGMIVYVQKTYLDSSFDSLNSIIGGQYYKYNMLDGEYRDSNTGNLLNAKENWDLIRLGIGLDSNEIIQLIDSDHVSARIDFNPIYDAIDASIQILDIMDFIGDPGLDGQFLISNGDNTFSWRTFGSLGLDSNGIIQLIDSDYVNARVSGIDSALVVDIIEETVTTAYIDARVTAGPGGGGTGTVDSPAVIALIEETLPGLFDSDFILSVIDSDYIQSARPPYVDSDYLNDVVDAKLQIIDIDDFIGPAENAGQYIISDGQGGATWKTIGSLGLDSYYITALIDSAYINARSDIDAAAVVEIIDQTYVQNQITEQFLINTLPEDFGAGIDSPATIALLEDNIGSFVDSAFILSIVDSAFIQRARPPYVDSDYLNDTVDAKLQVFDVLDNIIETEGLPGQILRYAGNGEFTWRDLNDLDSDLIIRIIDSTPLHTLQINQVRDEIPLVVDSAFVQQRVFFDTTVDSDFVETVFATKNLSYFVDSIGNEDDVLHSNGDGTYYWSRIDQDSATITQIVNIIQGDVDVPGIELPNVLDSDDIISFIDSDYVNSRATFEIDSGEVVDIILEQVDSAYMLPIINDVTTEIVDAKVQSLDFGDLIGDNGDAGFYLRSLGNGDAEWVNLQNEIADEILRNSLDSVEVLDLIDGTYINSLVDLSSVPGTVTTIVDSAYINLRVDGSGLGGGTGTVDSPAVISLITETVDSDYVEPFIDNQVQAKSIDLIQANIQVLDIGDLVGKNGDAGEFLVSKGNGEAEWRTFGSFGLDSSNIITLIDSAYVNDRVIPAVDSDEVFGLIDSDYINARVDFQAAGVDSIATLTLIRENSIDSAEAAILIDDLGLDSAEITYFIRDLIHANIQVIDFNEVFGIGYGAAGTYLKSAGGTQFEWDVVRVDSNLVTPTVLNIVDSAFIGSIVTPGFINSKLDRSLFLDSAEAIALIDSDYINARVDIDSDYINARVDATIDSDAIFTLIDSDYVNARVIPAVDSGDVINLIDSDYINARVVIPDAGTDSATVLDIVVAEINALDIGDIVGDNGNAGYYLKSLGNGQAEWSAVVGGSGGGGLTESQVVALINEHSLDSAEIQSLIDGTYIRSFVNGTYINSLVDLSSIDSNYINSRLDQTLFLDSAETIALIDSDYVNARVVPAVDSADVIQLIDSDYVNARVNIPDAGTDSATVLDIVVAELNALDIGDVVGDNGSPGQVLQSSGNGQATWEPKGILPTIGGQLALGSTPVWSGSAGVDSASQTTSGEYRITFTNAYQTDSDYSVMATYQDYVSNTGVFVNVTRSTTHLDVNIYLEGTGNAVDVGAITFLLYEF